MAYNYRMLIQYDGTRYAGWQKQGNTDATVQGKLEQLLSRLCGYEIEVFGAGRYGRRGARGGTGGQF